MAWIDTVLLAFILYFVVKQYTHTGHRTLETLSQIEMSVRTLKDIDDKLETIRDITYTNRR